MNILNLIFLILGTAIPSLLYILIIQLTSPYKSLKLKLGFEYFGVGFASVALLLSIISFLPSWSETNHNALYNFFIVVAPREELVKFLGFMLVYKLTERPKGSNPVSTMFYFGMVGLGFAMFENMTYVAQFGTEILVPRLITATVAHMLFGMFFGYWVGLSEIRYRMYTDRSVFGNLVYNFPTLKVVIYTIIGYLSAVIYHGLWNYNITVSGDAATPIMFLMIIFGLIGAKFGAKDLNDKYRKSLG